MVRTIVLAACVLLLDNGADSCLQEGASGEQGAEYRYFKKALEVRDKFLEFRTNGRHKGDFAKRFEKIVKRANREGKRLINWGDLNTPDFATYEAAISQSQHILSLAQKADAKMRKEYDPLVEAALAELPAIISFRAKGMAVCGRVVDPGHDDAMKAWSAVVKEFAKKKN